VIVNKPTGCSEQQLGCHIQGWCWGSSQEQHILCSSDLVLSQAQLWSCSLLVYDVKWC